MASNDVSSKPIRVGVVGGGQLARMMVQNAPLDATSKTPLVTVIPMDPLGEKSPAGKVVADKTHVRTGSMQSNADIASLADEVDVVTMDVEHVDVAFDEQTRGRIAHKLWPGINCVQTIQDKLVQKQWMQEKGVPVGTFYTPANVPSSVTYPVVVKARQGAYDGRGNIIASDDAELRTAISKLGGEDGCYVEDMLYFERELACIVVRQRNGHLMAYPVVDLYSANSACQLTVCPSVVEQHLQQRAQELAMQAVKALPDDAAGVFGVEMFLMPNEKVLFNELAPRPHNTGHYTIEACNMSQFEAHLRAVAGLPIPEDAVSLRSDVNAAVMYNIFGHFDQDVITKDPSKMPLEPSANARLHLNLYEKEQWRKWRKMGHCTAVGPSVGDCLDSLSAWAKTDLGYARPPVVGIIMGSMSDLPCMKDARNVLNQFGVPFELRVVSAHRTPEKMVEYAKVARDHGLKVIIAGAGGAAHLPGMVASLTTLPVIGVPVKSRALAGVDSLYSIVQMPRGVPVATVAIDNATNAALLAVRTLAITELSLVDRLHAYAEAQANK